MIQFHVGETDDVLHKLTFYVFPFSRENIA